jgi:MFS transporter, ACS family, tartrate transporter
MNEVGRSAVKTSTRYLIPFLLLLYFVNYLDRVNIGFAALTMNASIGLTASAFGAGASIFFIGYVLLEVPSNLILARVGARRWIARIMISWGIVSACMALVTGPYSFYTVRFLLGVAEAGFFPGIIFYLTNWFPAAYRARVVGVFMVGIPLSGLVGSPLSAFVMEHLDGSAGLHGWQWMFIAEGIPSIILGLTCLWALPDRPSESRRLTADERAWLENALAVERRERDRQRSFTVAQSLTNPRVIVLAIILFLVSSSLYGSIFWLPQVVKSFGLSNASVGWVAAIPYLAAVPLMVLWTRHSDRTNERTWHVAGPILTAAVGFIVTGWFITTPGIAMVGLTLACTGIYSAFPVFWSLPASFLSGTAAAAAIALIAAIGNFSGIIAPALIGWSKDATGGFASAMFGLAAALVIAASMVLAVQHHQATDAAIRTPSAG